MNSRKLDIYREEIYVSSFSGPAGLKRGSIYSLLTQICSSSDVLFAYWRVSKKGFPCVLIIAFGTMDQLDKIRASCHPSPDSPIQWFLHKRFPTSVTLLEEGTDYEYSFDLSITTECY